MQTIKIGAAIILACALSFFGGMYFGPKEQSVKVEQTKKTDTVRNVDKKETILPDGTKITETKSTTKKTIDSKLNSETKIESRPDYRIGLIFVPRMAGIQAENVVVDVQKRIVGEFYMGLSVSTQKQIGVSIGLGF